MNILVFGINYFPELTGIGKYTTEMCEWLVDRGHSVHVITAMPYYPQWKIDTAYRGKWWHTEVINGVHVHRTPLYVPQNVTGVSRIIHEFSFACASLYFWIPSLFKKYDCIISVCPPFHLGFQSLIYQFFRKIPVIYHIQDLQVDAARKLGLIKSEKIVRFLEKAEYFILKRVQRISSISPGMKEKILCKGVPAFKYINLPNWVEIEKIKPLSVKESLRVELGFREEDKIVLYSGNLGEKQGLEIIIEAAINLSNIPHLYFVFVGEGALKQRLMELTKFHQLKNVLFLPLQPYNKLSRLLAMADLHLVVQKKAAADLLFPSKLMSILASGGVPIVTAEPATTLFNLINNHHLGIIINPEDAESLTLAIKKYIHTDTSDIRDNARNYAMTQLNITKILSNFEEDLYNLKKNG